MQLHNTLWQVQMSALSSISHGGETRGTITLLRRELIMREGQPVHVPVISGNAWRGRLRRVAEELFRDAIGYGEDDDLPLSAIHTLRTGGSLAKTSGRPLTGSRLRVARELIPPLALFGAATGGRTVEGALHVGKIMPITVETGALTGVEVTAPDVFSATQLETYTRQDESTTPAVAELPLRVPLDTSTGEVDLAAVDPGSDFTLFRVETFPAGMRFSSWLRAHHLTGHQLAFLADLLSTFTAHGTLGGRAAIGHGLMRVDLEPRPGLPEDLPDWRAPLQQRREEVLEALRMLT